MLQFDDFDDGADKHNALTMLDAINEVIQQRFGDSCPQILTSAVDDSDIEISGTMTDEECSHCGEEVQIMNDFKIQVCPNCKCPILPCSVCEDRTCDKCPLENEEYRTKLIDRAMEILYKDDDSKYDANNRTYLESLTNLQISIKVECKLEYLN